MKRLTPKGFVIFACAFLASCATGRIAHNEGLAASQRGDFDLSIEKLEEAVKAEPDNLTYRIDLRRIREQTVHSLIADAEAARANGDFASAEQFYRRVLAVAARNGRALRGLETIEDDRAHRSAAELAQQSLDAGNIDDAKARLRSILSEDPGFQQARELLEKIHAAEPPISVAPVLHTFNNAPVTLQFRDADTQMVFEVLSRQTGINFIFDKDISRDGKTTIFVQNVPIEQAIDLVLSQNQLGRQILSENMVLIYPNTPAKQLEYQDQIVKTFYLSNADPQHFAEMLKTMLNVTTLFVDPRSNSVVIRDTPEIVRMSENLLASIDVAEAEVMMEVEVLEITRSKLLQLGIQYPTAATLNPTPLAGDPLVLADLGDQDDTTITVTPVPVTIDLRKEAGDANLLASPRIRSRNREKATVMIGQRVPVINNSVTPTGSGTSVVTGSVQYVDVGLTLDVEPTVHLDNSISIKVDLEVSNVIQEIFNSSSGTLAYQIGTRNASTLLQLRNGETQVLAGLIQNIDRSSTNSVPGLGDMPIIGRLFGTRKDDLEESEIVLSITPRIIRSQPRAPSESTEFWYGTDTNMRSAPLAATSASSRSVSATGSGLNGANTANRMSLNPEPAAGDDDDDRRSDSAPPQRLSLDWNGPGQVSVGEEFTVTLMLDSPTPLASLRGQVRYDQAALELLTANVGDFAPANVRSRVTPEIRQRGGRVALNIEEFGSAPASGSGSILILNFRSLTPRPTTMISVQQFAASGSDGLSVPAIAPRPFTMIATP